MTRGMREGTVIHPTAVIDDGVTIGAGCIVHPFVVIRSGTVLGDRVSVHPFAVIGGDPQDLKFDPSVRTGVTIGDGTVIREHATVHRATSPERTTAIGANCLLMTNSHVAHDCRVGDNVIIANGALVSGFVDVGDNAFVSGNVAIHQYTRVGEGCMIGGLARISLNVPPFVMVAERDEVIGLNTVGLRRRGFAREAIRELKDAFRKVYFTPGNIREIAATVLASGTFRTPEALRFLEFFNTGRRGFARPRREGMIEDETET